MIRPDFRDFHMSPAISHSAKGTIWKTHKYIKKENGKYYYEQRKEEQTNKNKE